MNEAYFDYLHLRINFLLQFFGLHSNKFVWVKTIFNEEKELYSCFLYYGSVSLFDFNISETHIAFLITLDNIEKHLDDENYKRKVLGEVFDSIKK